MEKMDMDQARKMIGGIKDGTVTATKLCEELLTKAREYTISPEKYMEFLDFKAKFYNYSLNNCLMILLQNSNATFVASFTKFKALGYSVKKGEHGMTIIRPEKINLLKIGDELKRLKDATRDEKILAAKGEIPVIQKTYFKPATVFDVSQTTIPQKDLPKILGSTAVQEDSGKRYEKMREVVESHGIKIEVKDLKSIALKGYYSPGSENIVLNDNMNAEDSFKVLTHEFAHAALHKNSFNEPKANVEFEAESTAYLVFRQLDIDTSDYSFRYINSHFKNMTDPEVGQSLKRIINASGYIVSKFKETGTEVSEVKENTNERMKETEKPRTKGFKRVKKGAAEIEETL